MHFYSVFPLITHGLFHSGILQPVDEVNYSQVSSGVAFSQVRRTDVDKDFLLLFNVVNENLSWYLDENIQTFCLEPANVDPSDPDFQHSNHINGKCFCKCVFGLVYLG